MVATLVTSKKVFEIILTMFDFHDLFQVTLNIFLLRFISFRNKIGGIRGGGQYFLLLLSLSFEPYGVLYYRATPKVVRQTFAGFYFINACINRPFKRSDALH